MTPLAFALVIAVGVLCLLNLVLLLAVLRRLREHTAELDRLSGGVPPPFRAELPGQSVPPFDAAVVDGTSITHNDLLGRPRLVGFFSAGCEPCHEQAPEFEKQLTGNDGDTLAMIIGDGPDADELVALLRDRAAVITDPDATTVAEAFGIQGFPTFMRLNSEGIVVAAGNTVRDVREPAVDAARRQRLSAAVSARP